METNIVSVKLWGQQVGLLSWNNDVQKSVFEFDETFLSSGLDIAPLTAPTASYGRNNHPIMGENEKIFQGLPSFLADSLPDNWGNQVFEEWIKRNGVNPGDVNAVDKLSYIGKRGMGAFEFEPSQMKDEQKAFSLNVKKLYDFARERWIERSSVHLQIDNLIIQDLYRVGTSAGGRRPKAIIAYNNKTGEICSGQGEIPPGFDACILKFPEGKDMPPCNVEYVYYLMAKKAGIQMMPSRLFNCEGINFFMTQRFDRLNGEKIHTQSMLAMNPYSDCYEDLFAICRRLRLHYEDSQQVFLRMAFNVLSGNVDDHNKNFAFCMDSKGEWGLSPAYDLTFAVDLSAPRYMNHHCLSVNGKTHDISEKDLLICAENNDVKNASSLLDQVKDAISSFSQLAQENEVPHEWQDKIEKVINNR